MKSSIRTMKKSIKLDKGGGQREQTDQMSAQRFSSCNLCLFTVADLFARRHSSCLCTVPLCVCTETVQEQISYGLRMYSDFIVLSAAKWS